MKFKLTELTKLTRLTILFLALAASASAQWSRKSTLVGEFDLDGAASSATAIHSADTITDSASFTIDAQPDTPRPLQATLTDADSSITACVYTVVGTLASGTSVTSTTDLTGGSGVKTLSPNYNFATVTSASVGVCTGEGVGDTVSLGTSSTIPDLYFVSGPRQLTGQGARIHDPWGRVAETRKVKTTGSSTSLTSDTAASSAFQNVSAGDLLIFNVKGQMLERVVKTKADADNVTVEDAIDLSAGYPYYYKSRYFGPDADDGWFPVNEFVGGALTLVFDVAQINGTGGIDLTLQCRQVGASAPVVTVSTTNVTAAGQTVVALDLRLNSGYDQCRAGLGWGTNDDASDTGSAQEIITVQLSAVKAVQ